MEIVSNIIAGLALLLSLFTLLTSSSGYELGNEYRLQLLSWYKETEQIIKELQYGCFTNEIEKKRLLAQLSTQIEVGRFFFPNKKRNTVNVDKLPAYRGERNLVLSCLVNIYQAFADPDSIKPYLSKTLPTIDVYIEDRLKKYTSIVFEIISPEKWNKSRKRYSNTNTPNQYSDKELDNMIGKE